MIQKILQKLGIVKNISQENKELQDFSGVKNLSKTSKRNITEFAKEENLNYNLAREDVTIGAGETKIVPLGVKINITNDWVKKHLDRGFFNPRAEERKEWFLKNNYLEIILKRSLAVKGLIISNGIGVVDLDYPDEIGLIVHNPIKKPNVTFDENNVRATFKMSFGDDFTIKKGDKICQCTLKKHKGYLMGYESDVIRDGGFGSTDK